jgi:DNA-directed RNA polymerase specialized sigma24 family protein
VDLVRREQRARRRELHSGPKNKVASRVDGEEIAWVEASLARLPENDQVLLMQRIGHGLTLREAAASVGIGEQAAHGRVRRALGKLRELAREVLP